MSRDDVYLRHILDAILSVEEYVTAGRGAFMSDSMRQDAVEGLLAEPDPS